MRTSELVREESSTRRIEPARTPTGIKTILLHIQNDANLEARLQVALSLARANGAHLRCLHVTPIEAYVTADTLGGVFVMDRIIEQIDQEEDKLRADLTAHLSAEDVSWDYEQVTANTVAQLVRCAALSDIVVTSREAHRGREQALETGIIGDVLTSSRTPLFIPGDDQAAFDPFGTAVIAWNDSYEASNAVRNAVPLLKLSSEVRVVRFVEGEQAPPMSLLEYLSRHDIHARLDDWVRDGEPVAELLTEYAKQKGASYIVMGGYSHSRAGEFLFGGVTRSLLKKCPVPLFVAH